MELRRVMYSIEHPLGPTIGEDVRCCKHAIHKYESNLIGEPPYDRAFGKVMDEAVLVIRQREGMRPRHRIDQELFDVLWRYMDAYRRLKYRRFTVPEPEPPPIAVCHPLPLGAGGTICQGIHQTAGLLGNAAIDFCADPGTKVLAVEDATIRRLSGRNPNDDTWDSQGVYGWSIHYETRHGYRYYLTHLGQRNALAIGQRVLAGQVLGRVGDQDFRPDHLHLGVTSPLGWADGVKHILAVASAPRVVPRP